MKRHFVSKNPDLTKQALDFIYHHGRQNFDNMVNDLLSNRMCPIKEGWIKRDRKNLI